MTQDDKHQDPAEKYRTDRKVETEEQEDPKDAIEENKKAFKREADKTTDIMHGADLGVHTDLPEN